MAEWKGERGMDGVRMKGPRAELLDLAWNTSEAID